MVRQEVLNRLNTEATKKFIMAYFNKVYEALKKIPRSKVKKKPLHTGVKLKFKTTYVSSCDLIMEIIPLRNCFLTISFFIATIPDSNRHRSLFPFELSIILVICS